MLNLISYLSLLILLGSCAAINTAPPTEIEGSWVGACGTTTRESATFTGDVAYFSSTAYGGGSCTSTKWIFVKAAKFTIGDFVVTRSGERKYNFTQSSLTLTPKSTAGVSELNTNSTCGLTDWALDISRDITGRTCDTIVQPTNATTTYSIYKFNTVANPKELQLGANGGAANGSSEATRHSSLSSVLTKQ